MLTAPQLDGHLYTFAGWNSYYLPQYAADPNGAYERTADVDVVFRYAYLRANPKAADVPPQPGALRVVVCIAAGTHRA